MRYLNKKTLNLLTLQSLWLNGKLTPDYQFISSKKYSKRSQPNLIPKKSVLFSNPLILISKEVSVFKTLSIMPLHITRMFILFFYFLESYYKWLQQLLKSFGILNNFKILPKKLTNKNLFKLWPNLVKLLILKLGKLYGLILTKEKELLVFKASLMSGKNTS